MLEAHLWQHHIVPRRQPGNELLRLPRRTKMPHQAAGSEMMTLVLLHLICQRKSSAWMGSPS
jgi:hypothetical protein